jgi:HD-GYP domain-containing protein (c-di-GMP phosphodiesterase class II)
LTALAGSLELRERYTAGHSWRVRDYALLLADALRLKDAAFLASLRQVAFLHDLGKIGIPDGILLKQGPLEPAEKAAMPKHPEMGASLLGDIPRCGRRVKPSSMRMFKIDPGPRSKVKNFLAEWNTPVPPPWPLGRRRRE